MPFLYNLLMGKLARPPTGNASDDEGSSDDGSLDLSAFDEPTLPSEDLPDLPIPPLEGDPLADQNPKIPLNLTEDDVMEVDGNILRPSSNPATRKLLQNEDVTNSF
jgi:hypothetical protein